MGCRGEIWASGQRTIVEVQEGKLLPDGWRVARLLGTQQRQAGTGANTVTIYVVELESCVEPMSKNENG